MIEKAREKKRVELEEAEKLAEEFRAQELSRLFDNPSRVEFKDKYMRTIKVMLDMMQHYSMLD